MVDQEVLYALKSATPRVAAAPATQPKPGPEPSAQPATAPARAKEPAPEAKPKAEPEVAALAPQTGFIGDGETWRATAVTPYGSSFVATLKCEGDRLRLEVEFDHRDNPTYHSYLVDRYTKSCTESASRAEFDCWFRGEIVQNRPSAPGARVRGRLPRLRVEAHNIVGAAELVFRPAP